MTRLLRQRLVPTLLVCVSVLCLGTPPTGAQPPQPPMTAPAPPAPPVRVVPPVDAGHRDAAGPAVQDKTSVTRHTIRVGGQPIAYTATAGTLVLRDDLAKPVASFFYVFYSRDNVADLGKRPIVYSFNGGPGTASIWMHMGFTGPRRVLYDDKGLMVQPPFRLLCVGAGLGLRAASV